MENPTWTLISFYTPLYKKMAARLEKSCQLLDIPYRIQEVRDRGSWEENCCYKPEFILRTLLELKAPVLWVDADAEMVRSPNRTFHGHFGAILNEHLEETHPSRVMSGVVYAAYCEEAVRILKKWIAYCQLFNSREWDQIALRYALEGEVAFALPPEYSSIHDRVAEDEKPIVIHYQASRLSKKIFNNEVIDLF